jgi:hypothetical protein
MNHNYIDQSDLIDRYLMGKLAAEESARFEEHFVDCPRCVEGLKTTQSFIQGLRLAQSQQISQASIKPRATFWSLLKTGGSKPLTLATGCLLVIAVAGAIFTVIEVRRLKSEVDQAKSASAQWEHLLEQEQQAASLSEDEHQKREQELIGKLRELETKAQNQQEQRPGKAAEPGGWMRPAINLLVFVFNPVKRGEQSSSEPVNEATLPRSPTDFAVSLALEGEAKYQDYQVTLLDSSNRTIWKKGGLKPDRYNYISIGFNSNFFQPGEYLLTVEGVTTKGGSSPIGNYSFRVIKKP